MAVVLFIVSILAIIVGIIGAVTGERRMIWAIVIGALLCFGTTFRTVDSGAVGVPVTFGRINLETELSEGLHTGVAPWKTIHVQTMRIEEYTMSIAPTEGDKQGNDAIDVLTSDGLKVTLDMTVRYSVQPGMVGDIFKTYGNRSAYLAKVIRPTARAMIRSVAAEYSWEELYSTRRAEFVTQLNEDIGADYAAAGFMLDVVLLRNVFPPDAVVDAINAKIQAQEGIITKQYERQIAEEEALRVVVEAQGIADAQAVIDKTLTPEYLEYERIQMQRELANSPNTTFIFIPESGLSLDPDLDDFR